jgi:D-sedoheptulose 7-phosphate isomerase
MYWDLYTIRIMEALKETDAASLRALARTLATAWDGDHAIFTCGNGGSASTASHLAQDLAKGTIIPGVLCLRAFCLCDSIPNITAWANDTSYAYVFSEQLRIYGQQGDILIAVSGSGNSENVLNAVKVAHEKEMRTWGVTGFDGGKLIELAHRCVHVPSDDMGIVEAVHGVIFHWLIRYLRVTHSGEAEKPDWLSK